jgi:hypothetical protein
MHRLDQAIRPDIAVSHHDHVSAAGGNGWVHRSGLTPPLAI